MQELKLRITSALALVSIDYSKPLRPVIILVDRSKKGQSAVIQQEDLQGQRHPVRFESSVQSASERNQDLGKHKCKAMLLVLKKFCLQIYSIHFIVETDTQTLVDQLNQSATNLLGALITRQLALLNIQEFEVRYIAGKRNVITNALSQRLEPKEQELPVKLEEDIEEFINRQIRAVTLSNPVLIDHQHLAFIQKATTVDLLILESLVTTEFQTIAKQLVTMQNPRGMSRSDLRKLRKKALKFAVINDCLQAKMLPRKPLQRVINNLEEQRRIIHALYNKLGH